MKSIKIILGGILGILATSTMQAALSSTGYYSPPTSTTVQLTYQTKDEQKPLTPKVSYGYSPSISIPTMQKDIFTHIKNPLVRNLLVYATKITKKNKGSSSSTTPGNNLIGMTLLVPLEKDGYRKKVLEINEPIVAALGITINAGSYELDDKTPFPLIQTDLTYQPLPTWATDNQYSPRKRPFLRKISIAIKKHPILTGLIALGGLMTARYIFYRRYIKR